MADWRDALPKPGLDTEEGRAIQDVLDTRINPSVASHGGSISLIDVADDRVYIRMDGGCQGCGMASVTLKQGVEKSRLSIQGFGETKPAKSNETRQGREFNRRVEILFTK